MMIMEEKGIKRFYTVDFGNKDLSGSMMTVDYDEVSKTIFCKTPKRLPSDPLQ